MTTRPVAPIDHSLILTNDDGVTAPGLAALNVAAAGLGRLATIAPAGPESSCGHAVTTHRPVRVEPRGPGWYAVDGKPADCVRLGLAHLEPEAAWVISGINAGGNLGVDVYISGTVAAAREAVLHGRPAIALSHYIHRSRAIDWDLASRRARRVLDVLLHLPWEPGTLWNVNLPHLEAGAPEPELVFCPLDPSPLPLAYRLENCEATYTGVYRDRARQPGSDVDVCFGGQISVTRLRLFPLEMPWEPPSTGPGTPG